MSHTPETTLALFPLSSVLFPMQAMQLRLFESRYRKLMQERAHLDPIFGVVLIAAGDEVGGRPAIHEVGTAASLDAAVVHPDGQFSIAISGGRRFQVLDQDWSSEYLVARVRWMNVDDDLTPFVQGLSEQLGIAFVDYVVAMAKGLGEGRHADRLSSAVTSAFATDPSTRGFQIAAQLPLNTWQQQQILEIEDIRSRLEAILSTVKRERAQISISGPVAAVGRASAGTFSPN